MRLKIEVYADNNLIGSIQENVHLSWVRHEQPSVFRRLNLKPIDSLSRILEKVGLRIVKHDEPDVDHFMYLAWFHPMTNDSLLKGVNLEGLRREYNKKESSLSSCKPEG